MEQGPRQEFGGVGVRAVCCKQRLAIQPGRHGGLLGLGTGTKPGISDRNVKCLDWASSRSPGMGGWDESESVSRSVLSNSL